jgi:hypothetical protein
MDIPPKGECKLYYPDSVQALARSCMVLCLIGTPNGGHHWHHNTPWLHCDFGQLGVA